MVTSISLSQLVFAKKCPQHNNHPFDFIPGYPYMEQLLVLDRCKEKDKIKPAILRNWSGPIATPALLENSSCKAQQSEVYHQGFMEGFRIGFQRGATPLKTFHRNMPLANSHRAVVSTYLKGELQEGHIACCGTLHDSQQLKACISFFGVIPKKGSPNCLHLIMNLKDIA